MVNLESKRGQLARYQLTSTALEPQTLFPTADDVRSARRLGRSANAWPRYWPRLSC